MTSDAELLRRYAHQGSEEAFTELVHRHIDFVYAAARRQCRDTCDAEDVVQAVFTDLARKAGRLCERDELVGWLFVSARFAAAKTIRGEARRSRWERKAGMENSLNQATEAQADWEQLRPQLDTALSTLRENDRNAILLRVFKGCSFAEVGTAQKISEEAARKRVDRALEKLRDVLARRGITSSAAALTMAISTQAAIAAPVPLAMQISTAALAKAAESTSIGSLAWFIQFMTTTKTVSMAVVAGSLAVGIAVHEMQQMQAAEQEQRQASREVAAQAEHLQLLKERLEKMERERDALRKAAADAEAQQAKASSASTARLPRAEASVSSQLPPERAALADRLARGAEFLSAHPEAREMLRTLWHAERGLRNAALYKDLELTEAQIKGVEKFLEEDSSTSFVLTSGERVALSLKNPPLLGTGEESRRRQRELRALLGEEKADRFREAFKESNSVLGARLFAGQVAGALCFTDTPLTPSQGKALADIFLKNNADYQSGRRLTDYSSQDWDQTIADSKAVLSEPQLAAVNEIRLRQAYFKKLKSAEEAASLKERSMP